MYNNLCSSFLSQESMMTLINRHVIQIDPSMFLALGLILILFIVQIVLKNLLNWQSWQIDPKSGSDDVSPLLVWGGQLGRLAEVEVLDWPHFSHTGGEGIWRS